MPRRLRPGRNQLNIINVLEEVIREFDDMRKGKGPGGLDVPRWQLFEQVWSEWKYYKAGGSALIGEVQVFGKGAKGKEIKQVVKKPGPSQSESK